MSRFSFSLLICVVLTGSCGFAQETAPQEKPKTEKSAADSTRKLPTGIRIAFDVLGPVNASLGSDTKASEFAVDTDFGKYFVTAEFGTSSRSTSIPDGFYANSGTYLRIGADVNFLRKDPDRNMFFLGARYGRVVYDETLSYLSETDFPAQVLRAENSRIQSGWLELTTGLKVRVFRIFWMGYTARMKFAPSTPDNSPLVPYDIPGYGLTFKKPWWGFNYYVMMRIPFTGEGKAKSR